MFDHSFFHTLKKHISNLSIADWSLISIFAAGSIFLTIGFWWLFNSGQLIESLEEAPEVLDSDEQFRDESAKPSIMVEVSGAVKSPGMFELPIESRVGQALAAAGGTSPDANQKMVQKELNLAQQLSDGEKIYIPFASDVESLDISPENQIPAENVFRPENLGRVSINEASIDELESLPGVGEKRATDIIQNRPYQTLNELVSKQIISQSLFDKISESITL